MANTKPRESSFELMRIIAQYMIVFYHILYFIVYVDTGTPFYKAMWLPLHIGVPLFVMISGYFGIKTDVKRMIKLLGLVFVFQVPYLIINNIIGGERLVGLSAEGSLVDWARIIFFISGTPNWFMRTYLFLFLLAPVINTFIKNCTLKRRVLLLLVLFFISHYVGTLGFDPSLADGKNVVTFIFFYVIGDTLRVYKNRWMRIPKWLCVFFYCAFNLIILFIYSAFEIRVLDSLFYRLFYSYNSVGLLFNTILFLITIGHFEFYSSAVNRVARASIAMYLLQPYYFLFIIPYIISWLYSVTHMGVLSLTVSLMLFSALLIILSWIVFEALTPVWKQLDRLGSWCQLATNRLCYKFLKA